jgi:uncharacterized protein (TIGR00369 family)
VTPQSTEIDERPEAAPTPPPPGAAEWILGTGALAAELVTTKLGIRITDWNPQRLVGTMPVAGNLQTYGFLHGGASAALAETLGSLGALLHAGENGIVLGQELSCTHHRAARGGPVTAVCVPLYLGDAVTTHEIVISDEHGRRICTARLSCQVRRGPARRRREAA